MTKSDRCDIDGCSMPAGHSWARRFLSGESEFIRFCPHHAKRAKLSDSGYDGPFTDDELDAWTVQTP
jgi:hypothetical protein